MTAWEIIEPAVTLMTSVSSIVVAAVVGSAVIKSQKEQREHNKLTVRPLIHARIESVNSEGIVYFLLSNHGVGPARINSLKFRLQSGEIYSSERLMDLCLLLVPSLAGRCKFHTMSMNYPYTVKVGDRIEVLRITIDQPEVNDGLAMRVANSVKNNANCDIYYESLYGEKFSETNP